MCLEPRQGKCARTKQLVGEGGVFGRKGKRKDPKSLTMSLEYKGDKGQKSANADVALVTSAPLDPSWQSGQLKA